MTKNLETVLGLIDTHVKEFMNKNQSTLPLEVKQDPEKLEHAFDIATSIMRTKWKVGYPGGSFVTAVVENNLMRSFANADETSRSCLFFFVMMINNLDMPMDVYRFVKEKEELGV